MGQTLRDAALTSCIDIYVLSHVSGPNPHLTSPATEREPGRHDAERGGTAPRENAKTGEQLSPPGPAWSANSGWPPSCSVCGRPNAHRDSGDIVQDGGIGDRLVHYVQALSHCHKESGKRSCRSEEHT